MIEATFGRRVPGEGDLPLRDFLAALPRDLVVSLEVPMLAKRDAGIGAKERLEPAVKATREMLASL